MRVNKFLKEKCKKLKLTAKKFGELVGIPYKNIKDILDPDSKKLPSNRVATRIVLSLKFSEKEEEKFWELLEEDKKEIEKRPPAPSLQLEKPQEIEVFKNKFSEIEVKLSKIDDVQEKVLKIFEKLENLEKIIKEKIPEKKEISLTPTTPTSTLATPPPPTTEMFPLDKIVIPRQFAKSPPRPEKVEEAIEFYRKHKRFNKPVIIKRGNFLLIDGYSRYIAAKKLELKEIFVKFA